MANDLRINLDSESRTEDSCVVRWFTVGGRFVTLLLTLTLFLFSISCQTPISHPLPEQSAPPARVTLVSGDVIKLIFAGAPELNQSQKIRADGKVSLPQVGEVTAAGKTLSQFQSELVALYRAQLRNSDVLVTLESGATRVYMAGAVARPGPLVLDRPTTVLQAIMQAGGPNQFGNMRRVQIIRLVNGKEQTQVLDLQPTLAGHTTEPFYVRDGDVISVAQKAF
jgi:polysaccharide export outer membrane protein